MLVYIDEPEEMLTFKNCKINLEQDMLPRFLFAVSLARLCCPNRGTYPIIFHNYLLVTRA